MPEIAKLRPLTIYSSGGDPTVEVQLETDNGIIAQASVPFGSSVGRNEPIDLRDGDMAKWNGRGVTKALSNIETIIRPKVFKTSVLEQRVIDMAMIELDGTENKSKLGANAILAVSLAVARAAAESKQMPLYAYIAELYGGDEPQLLPVPLVSLIEGGEEYEGIPQIQSIMAVPMIGTAYHEALKLVTETYHGVQKAISDAKIEMGVGPEGGIVPRINSHKHPNEKSIDFVHKLLDLCLLGAENAGYKPGSEVTFAFDFAANSFNQGETYLFDGKAIGSEKLIEFYEAIIRDYPVSLVEDPFADNDLQAWGRFFQNLADGLGVVSDDLTSTNTAKINAFSNERFYDLITIAPSHAGTLSETLEAARAARKHYRELLVTHRSSETEDTFISHLAVGINAPLFKGGGILRGERVAKYNELLRIEEELGTAARFVSFRETMNKVFQNRKVSRN